jgi:hypothetical protein
MDQHVLLDLAPKTMVATSFDFKMSHGGVDTLVMVINFLNETWGPIHITMGLFEMNKKTKQSMVIQLQSLLKKFGLLH